jgi:hypothetical protein
MSATTARVIPQTFTEGAVVTIHPRYAGPTGRGIQRHKGYVLVKDSTNRSVFLKDDDGFSRERPLYQFVQVA